jgi:site-specific recombinase XerD
MNKPLPPAVAGSLRGRLIEDMNLRGFTEKTQRYYIRIISRFAAFLGRSPDTATPEDMRRWQLSLSELGMNPPAFNSAVAALRFFFTITLDRPDLSRKLVRLAYPRKLPTVLSAEEVAQLLTATTCLKHRAALAVAYGAGLRVAEVAALKVGDIDSQRMLIRVERGKGGRARQAMLSPDLLGLLRAWWKEGRRQGVMLPGGWLFPGQNPDNPITTRQLHRVVQEAARAAGIARRVAPTRYATASPPICWRTASISASSRRCSGMPSSTTPRCTPGWRHARSGPSPARWTGSRPCSVSAPKRAAEPRCAPLSKWRTSSGPMAQPSARTRQAI